jgi:Zn-finger nucleic acid-binding protein
MNFSSEMKGTAIQVELKYCERCGGLWLRPQRQAGVHCASCRACLEAMPGGGVASIRKARRQSPETDARKGQSPVQVDYLQGVAAVGVWA